MMKLKKGFKQNKSILIKIFIVSIFFYLGCNSSSIEDQEILKSSLQNMDINLVDVIFQFLNPKDFSDSVNKFLTDTQKQHFPRAEARKYGKSSTEYFLHENGEHFMPLNIKQMFIFEPSFTFPQTLQGSNFLYLTLSHDGNVDFQFNELGTTVLINEGEQFLKGVESLFFLYSKLEHPGTATFSYWEGQFSATPEYFLQVGLYLIPFTKTETRKMTFTSFHIHNEFSPETPYFGTMKAHEMMWLDQTKPKLISIVPSFFARIEHSSVVFWFHKFENELTSETLVSFGIAQHETFVVTINSFGVQIINFPTQNIHNMPLHQFFEEFILVQRTYPLRSSKF